MKTDPINYPCVMLEKNEHLGVINSIENTKFTILYNYKDYSENLKLYNDPIIIHYYSVINEAVKLSGLKFCNRSKTYVNI